LAAINCQLPVVSAGVQGINGVGQVHGEVLSCVQVSGNGNQDLGKVRVDAPVAMLVGIGQAAWGDFAADAAVLLTSKRPWSLVSKGLKDCSSF